jgi:hypothetical protein
MISIVIGLIILIPIFFFIIRWAIDQWNKMDQEDKKELVDNKLHEIELVDDLHGKISDVDLDDFNKKKEEVDKVIKS